MQGNRVSSEFVSSVVAGGSGIGDDPRATIAETLFKKCDLR